MLAHAPLLHTTDAPVAAEQTRPQPPQLVKLDAVSTHWPLHRAGIVPLVQPHLPPAHCSPAGHAVPHAPQLLGSRCKLTHARLQSVRPLAHIIWQVLVEQTSPFGHGLPHAAQFFGSDVVSTQVPPQLVPVVQPAGASGGALSRGEAASFVGVVSPSEETTGRPSGWVMLPSSCLTAPSGSTTGPSVGIIAPSDCTTAPSGSSTLPSGKTTEPSGNGVSGDAPNSRRAKSVRPQATPRKTKAAEKMSGEATFTMVLIDVHSTVCF
jgi:hypothetical protein